MGFGADGSRGVLVDFLLDLCSGLEPVSFEFDKHLLLHEPAVLIGHFVVAFFEDDVVVPELLQVVVELLLFLLNSLMVHLVEVFFLEQLLVCRLRFLCDDDRLVQLVF